MEWLTSIPDILSLLFGGSVISIVTWRFARRKAAADVKQAEAEAKKAEAEAQQEKQNYYQQIIDDVMKDRDYYKTERDEYRHTIKTYDARIDALERKQARQSRQLEMMRPFMCADLSCKLRKRVVLSDDGGGDTSLETNGNTSPDIEPIEQNVL